MLVDAGGRPTTLQLCRAPRSYKLCVVQEAHRWNAAPAPLSATAVVEAEEFGAPAPVASTANSQQGSSEMAQPRQRRLTGLAAALAALPPVAIGGVISGAANSSSRHRRKRRRDGGAGPSVSSAPAVGGLLRRGRPVLREKQSGVATQRFLLLPAKAKWDPAGRRSYLAVDRVLLQLGPAQHRLRSSPAAAAAAAARAALPLPHGGAEALAGKLVLLRKEGGQVLEVTLLETALVTRRTAAEVLRGVQVSVLRPPVVERLPPSPKDFNPQDPGRHWVDLLSWLMQQWEREAEEAEEEEAAAGKEEEAGAAACTSGTAGTKRRKRRRRKKRRRGGSGPLAAVVDFPAAADDDEDVLHDTPEEAAAAAADAAEPAGPAAGGPPADSPTSPSIAIASVQEAVSNSGARAVTPPAAGGSGGGCGSRFGASASAAVRQSPAAAQVDARGEQLPPLAISTDVTSAVAAVQQEAPGSPAKQADHSTCADVARAEGVLPASGAMLHKGGGNSAPDRAQELSGSLDGPRGMEGPSAVAAVEAELVAGGVNNAVDEGEAEGADVDVVPPSPTPPPSAREEPVAALAGVAQPIAAATASTAVVVAVAIASIGAGDAVQPAAATLHATRSGWCGIFDSQLSQLHQEDEAAQQGIGNCMHNAFSDPEAVPLGAVLPGGVVGDAGESALLPLTAAPLQQVPVPVPEGGGPGSEAGAAAMAAPVMAGVAARPMSMSGGGRRGEASSYSPCVFHKRLRAWGGLPGPTTTALPFVLPRQLQEQQDVSQRYQQGTLPPAGASDAAGTGRTVDAGAASGGGWGGRGPTALPGCAGYCSGGGVVLRDLTDEAGEQEWKEVEEEEGNHCSQQQRQQQQQQEHQTHLLTRKRPRLTVEDDGESEGQLLGPSAEPREAMQPCLRPHQHCGVLGGAASPTAASHRPAAATWQAIHVGSLRLTPLHTAATAATATGGARQHGAIITVGSASRGAPDGDHMAGARGAGAATAALLLPARHDRSGMSVRGVAPPAAQHGAASASPRACTLTCGLEAPWGEGRCRRQSSPQMLWLPPPQQEPSPAAVPPSLLAPAGAAALHRPPSRNGLSRFCQEAQRLQRQQQNPQQRQLAARPSPLSLPLPAAQLPALPVSPMLHLRLPLPGALPPPQSPLSASQLQPWSQESELSPMLAQVPPDLKSPGLQSSPQPSGLLARICAAVEPSGADRGADQQHGGSGGPPGSDHGAMELGSPGHTEGGADAGPADWHGGAQPRFGDIYWRQEPGPDPELEQAQEEQQEPEQQGQEQEHPLLPLLGQELPLQQEEHVPQQQQQQLQLPAGRAAGAAATDVAAAAIDGPTAQEAVLFLLGQGPLRNSLEQSVLHAWLAPPPLHGLAQSSGPDGTAFRSTSRPHARLHPVVLLLLLPLEYQPGRCGAGAAAAGMDSGGGGSDDAEGAGRYSLRDPELLRQMQAAGLCEAPDAAAHTYARPHEAPDVGPLQAAYVLALRLPPSAEGPGAAAAGDAAVGIFSEEDYERSRPPLALLRPDDALVLLGWPRADVADGGWLRHVMLELADGATWVSFSAWRDDPALAAAKARLLQLPTALPPGCPAVMDIMREAEARDSATQKQLNAVLEEVNRRYQTRVSGKRAGRVAKLAALQRVAQLAARRTQHRRWEASQSQPQSQSQSQSQDAGTQLPSQLPRPWSRAAMRFVRRAGRGPGRAGGRPGAGGRGGLGWRRPGSQPAAGVAGAAATAGGGTAPRWGPWGLGAGGGQSQPVALTLLRTLVGNAATAAVMTQMGRCRARTDTGHAEPVVWRLDVPEVRGSGDGVSGPRYGLAFVPPRATFTDTWPNRLGGTPVRLLPVGLARSSPREAADAAGVACSGGNGGGTACGHQVSGGLTPNQWVQSVLGAAARGRKWQAGVRVAVWQRSEEEVHAEAAGGGTMGGEAAEGEAAGGGPVGGGPAGGGAVRAACGLQWLPYQSWFEALHRSRPQRNPGQAATVAASGARAALPAEEHRVRNSQAVMAAGGGGWGGGRGGGGSPTAGAGPSAGPGAHVAAVAQLRSVSGAGVAALVAAALMRRTQQLTGPNAPLLWRLPQPGAAPPSARYAVSYCPGATCGYGDVLANRLGGTPVRLLAVEAAAQGGSEGGSQQAAGGSGDGCSQPTQGGSQPTQGGSQPAGGGSQPAEGRSGVKLRLRCLDLKPFEWFRRAVSVPAVWQSRVEVALLPGQAPPRGRRVHQGADGLAYLRYQDWRSSRAKEAENADEEEGEEKEEEAANTFAVAAASRLGGSSLWGAGGMKRRAAGLSAPPSAQPQRHAASGAAAKRPRLGPSGGSGPAGAGSGQQQQQRQQQQRHAEKATAGSASKISGGSSPVAAATAAAVAAVVQLGERQSGAAAAAVAAAIMDAGASLDGPNAPVLVRVRRPCGAFRFAVAFCPPGAEFKPTSRGRCTRVRIAYVDPGVDTAAQPTAAAAAGPQAAAPAGPPAVGFAAQVLKPGAFSLAASGGAQRSYHWSHWVQVAAAVGGTAPSAAGGAAPKLAAEIWLPYDKWRAARRIQAPAPPEAGNAMALALEEAQLLEAEAQAVAEEAVTGTGDVGGGGGCET